jgi:hypothetical protein
MGIYPVPGVILGVIDWCTVGVDLVCLLVKAVEWAKIKVDELIQAVDGGVVLVVIYHYSYAVDHQYRCHSHGLDLRLYPHYSMLRI